MALLHATRRHWLLCGALSAAAVWSSHAQAQTAASYPQRPIKLVVPFAPSGSTDLVARVIAQALHHELGQPVYVENKPGAGGMLGTEWVAQAKPDGYVLGLASISTLAVNPVVLKASRVQPLQDLEMVAPLASIASVFSTHPSLGVKDFAGFVQQARAQGDAWTAGSSGIGSIGHVILEALNGSLGTQLRHIPFKGMGPVVQSALAGQTQVLSDQFPSSAPYVQSGRLVPFAVAAPQRLPSLPQVPTLQELGYPALNQLAITWFGLVAPAGTSPEIVEKLNAATQRVLHNHEVQHKLQTMGVDTMPGTPQALRSMALQAHTQVERIVQERGITDGL